jgi:hypothetical protein
VAGVYSSFTTIRPFTELAGVAGGRRHEGHGAGRAVGPPLPGNPADEGAGG